MELVLAGRRCAQTRKRPPPTNRRGAFRCMLHRPVSAASLLSGSNRGGIRFSKCSAKPAAQQRSVRRRPGQLRSAAGGVGAVIVHVPPGADTSTPRRPGRGMTNTPQAGAVRGLLTDQQARVALGCCAIEWSQSGQNELTAKVGAATYLIAREWLLPSTPKWSVHLSLDAPMRCGCGVEFGCVP